MQNSLHQRNSHSLNHDLAIFMNGVSAKMSQHSHSTFNYSLRLLTEFKCPLNDIRHDCTFLIYIHYKYILQWVT